MQWRHRTNRWCATAPSLVQASHSTCPTCLSLTPLRHAIPLPLPATSPTHCSRTTWRESAWVVQTGQLCSDRETEPRGAESWRVALAAYRKAFSPWSCSPSWSAGNCWAGLAVLWLSVSLHPEISSSELKTLHCSTGLPMLNGHNMGSEEAYNFVFKGEYTTTFKNLGCSPSHLVSFILCHCYFWSHSFTLQITLPCLVVTQQCPNTWICVLQPCLHVHISVLWYASILLGLK